MSFKTPIYLDSAATAIPDTQCLLDYARFAQDYPYNPSSVYDGGRKARQALEKARHTIAICIHCDDSEIYFTSGGTEGNNMILRGFFKDKKQGLLITTQIEHPSILRVAEDLERNGIRIYYLPVDSVGSVDSKDLDNTLKMEIDDGMDPEDILVSIQYANNEIGYVQDISKLSFVAYSYGVKFHTDAVQYFPHCRIDLEHHLATESLVDAMTVSGHKFGAPRGVGFVFVRNGIDISPMILGGRQENGFRAGTENVAACMAMANKIDRMYSDPDFGTTFDIDEVDFESCITMFLNSRNIVYEINSYATIPVFSFTFPGVDASALISLMSERGIYLSAGSACHSHEPEPSHVLKAIGLSDDEAKSTVRICYYEGWTVKDIENAVEQLAFCIKLLKGE